MLLPAPPLLNPVGSSSTFASSGSSTSMIRGDLVRTLEHSLVRSFGFQAGHKMGFIVLGLVVVFLIMNWHSRRKHPNKRRTR